MQVVTPKVSTGWNLPRWLRHYSAAQAEGLLDPGNNDPAAPSSFESLVTALISKRGRRGSAMTVWG